ncbi:hypothetical protein C8R45DRAFT_977768 [Mycena sanguinolenta]|nr:hypothetical protein C8R45DRAFT_977768 [Mycena sanguinolenta]
MSYLSASTSISKQSESSAALGPTAPLRSHFDDHSTIHVPAAPALPAASTPFSADPAARRPSSRRSRRSQRSIPTPVRAAAGLAAFLPLPPLISVLYLACGHSILRSAHPTRYGAPIISSVRAGAAGGAILALPLAVLGYLLLFPTKPPDPDDFFDDDDEGEGVWDAVGVYATYAFCAVLVLTLGAISGALGIVCLPSSLLSAAEAAAAGIVGAVVLLSALTLVAGCGFLLWCLLWRRHPTKETQ